MELLMIDGDTDCAAYSLKRAQVFAIPIKDILYQADKETWV